MFWKDFARKNLLSNHVMNCMRNWDVEIGNFTQVKVDVLYSHNLWPLSLRLYSIENVNQLHSE